jgi:hypothetical protein
LNGLATMTDRKMYIYTCDEMVANRADELMA